MSKDTVTLEIKDTTALVTLNRPNSLNALSQDLMRELTAIFRALQANQDLSAAIITGAGRAFCAGLDLKELSEEGLEAFWAGGEIDILSAIADFDRPLIGAINGVAATGGFELALWCDILVASSNAKFVDTHARIGLVPGWGLTQRLQRIIGVNRARELHFTGNPLTAEMADRWGMVNRVVEPEDLLPACEDLARDIASCDQTTLKRMKRVVNEGGDMTLGNALNYETMAMDLHSASQSQDNIRANREKTMQRNRNKT